MPPVYIGNRGGTHAERGVLEESAPLPSEAQMQRPGEQQHIGERNRLRERGEPFVEPLEISQDSMTNGRPEAHPSEGSSHCTRVLRPFLQRRSLGTSARY